MEHQIVEHKGKQTLLTRGKYALATGVATATATFLPAMAHAAGTAELDFSGATAELGGVKTAVVGIIGILLTIFAIVIAWHTFRRSAG